MCLGPNHPRRTGDQPAARRTPPKCPACSRTMIDPGPPARWTICANCPYRIVPAAAGTSEADVTAGDNRQLRLDPRGDIALTSVAAE